jgi:excisionase family DNA binding protein
MEDLFTAQQIADYLGFKLITVYRLTRKRKIDVVLLGKEYRYTKSAVDKFIREHTLPAKD